MSQDTQRTSPGASPWARRTLAAILDGIEAGSITTCRHVPRQIPGIGAMALAYGKWECPACWKTELEKLTATCDRCRRQIPNEPSQDCQAFIDGVWLTYTLCDPCAAEDERETFDPAMN